MFNSDASSRYYWESDIKRLWIWLQSKFVENQDFGRVQKIRTKRLTGSFGVCMWKNTRGSRYGNVKLLKCCSAKRRCHNLNNWAEVYTASPVMLPIIIARNVRRNIIKKLDRKTGAAAWGRSRCKAVAPGIRVVWSQIQRNARTNSLLFGELLWNSRCDDIWTFRLATIYAGWLVSNSPPCSLRLASSGPPVGLKFFALHIQYLSHNWRYIRHLCICMD